jgi:DNA-binding response OmpR family regulator
VGNRNYIYNLSGLPAFLNMPSANTGSNRITHSDGTIVVMIQEKESITMNKKKIAVIDDDPLISKLIDICLRNKGHEVKVLNSGIDAVKYLFEERPDTILLDIVLPDCDGWFIAKLTKTMEWTSSVPLIIMSVLEPETTTINTVQPHAYIQKPFAIEQLLQAVELSLTANASA